MALFSALLVAILVAGGAGMIMFFPGRAKIIGLIPFIIGFIGAAIP